MIKVNNEKITIGNFPDGTLLIKQETPGTEHIQISWYYEEEKELIALMYLVNHFKAHGCENISLYMPYIPNARQDRVKSEEDVFTLKYFANIINSLGFKEIVVRDPHSNVSEALINNIRIMKPDLLIEDVIRRIQYKKSLP